MLSFRKLQTKDIRDLKKLFRTTIEGFSWYSGSQKEEIIKPYKTDRFVQIIENKNYICTVGFHDKKLICFAFGYYSGGVFTLLWVVVDKDYQKKGIGKKLLQKLFSYCKTKNCHQMIAARVTENKASSALLRSLGFQRYALIQNHFYHKTMELFYYSL